MRTLLLAGATLTAAAVAAPLNDFSAFSYDPAAAPAAVVTSGAARFTVLSPYVIRMEQADAKGNFEDRATLMAVKRKLPGPSFTHFTEDGTLTIQTGKVSLTYTVGEAFAPSTLSVTTAAGADYHFGALVHAHPFGTAKSLDELCTVPLTCTPNADYRIHVEGLHLSFILI